ncbi:MAG: SDR family oxidoreductase [Bryobacteraceae bacterium]
MRTLVIGGTGTVGSRTVSNLLSRGAAVRVLTRDAHKARELPQGVEPAIGDTARPGSLREAFRGVDSVFLITPLSQDESERGVNAVEAAREAGVRRMVYMSVHRVDEAPHIPHFSTKYPVEQALRESGMEWTLLQPNNFYQNDFWFREAIVRQGVYPQPIGNVGISRVDVRDIADAAVNALTQPGHEGKTYPLVGPEVLTGDSTAAVYARLLGRPVHYAGDDLDAFAALVRGFLPEWLVRDFRIMYQYFQTAGLKATSDELALQTRVLRHEPRRFEAFVAEIAPAWTGAASANR